MIDSDRILSFIRRKKDWVVNRPDKVKKWFKKKNISIDELPFEMKKRLLNFNKDYFDAMPSIHNDKNFAISIIDGDKEMYDLFTNLHNDCDVCMSLAATKTDYENWDDRDITVYQLYFHPENYKFIPETMLKNPDFIRKAIQLQIDNSNIQDCMGDYFRKTPYMYLLEKYPKEMKEKTVEFFNEQIDKDAITPDDYYVYYEAFSGIPGIEKTVFDDDVLNSFKQRIEKNADKKLSAISEKLKHLDSEPNTYKLSKQIEAKLEEIKINLKGIDKIIKKVVSERERKENFVAFVKENYKDLLEKDSQLEK